MSFRQDVLVRVTNYSRLLLLAVMSLLIYQTGLLELWTQSDEYGHGLMVVGVLVVLLHRRWDSYRPYSPGSTWLIVLVGLISSAMVIAGDLSGITLLGYYGILLFSTAIILAIGGCSLAMKLSIPVLIGLLILPLPTPIGPLLTSKLQLISSSWGVWVIRLLGGSVYLQGNVIDVGGTQLLVAEACSGLRYLFPLMSIGAVIGYALRSKLWIRLTVFLATIPITLFLNSLRIAMTGLLVESGEGTHTEGLQHLFEGWVVFISAVLMLVGLASVLLKFQPGATRLCDAWNVQSRLMGSHAGYEDSSARKQEKINFMMIVSFVLLTLVGGNLFNTHTHAVPHHKALDEFPSKISDWTSHSDRLSPLVEEVAGASEYFYGDFTDPDGHVVNAYVSYYESQRNGHIPHSPKVCMPGGGWMIDSLEAAIIRPVTGAVFEANRLVTSSGGRTLLSYYWLKQGNRYYRHELQARLDLIRFSLFENRTDGALIRLVTELRPGETLQVAESRLELFAGVFANVLTDYVPD